MPNGWTETTLYTFMGSDGSVPDGPLVRDASGNFYGAASAGGDLNCNANGGGCGVIFELSATGKFTILHTFTGPDGDSPEAGLLLDSSTHTLYGTTFAGGDLQCASQTGLGCGTVFKIAP